MVCLIQKHSLEVFFFLKVSDRKVLALQSESEFHISVQILVHSGRGYQQEAEPRSAGLTSDPRASPPLTEAGNRDTMIMRPHTAAPVQK